MANETVGRMLSSHESLTIGVRWAGLGVLAAVAAITMIWTTQESGIPVRLAADNGAHVLHTD